MKNLDRKKWSMNIITLDITEKDSSLSWKEMEKKRNIIEFIKRRKWFYNREIYRECLIVLEKLN